MKSRGLLLPLLVIGCTEGSVLIERPPDKPNDPPCVEHLRARGTTAPFGRGSAIDVALLGSTAVVLTSIALETYDVTDRDRPVPLGAIALAGRPAEVALDGAIAWVAAGSAGVLAIDLSDPSVPVVIDRIQRYRSASGVEPLGERLLVADAEKGLAILDREGDTIAELPIASIVRVRAEGELAYVATGTAGLAIVDLEERAIVGRLAMPGAAENLAISGTTVFVSAGQGGVRIVDVSEPAHPTELGEYGGRGGWTAREVAVRGDRAYVASGVIRSFRVLDIGDLHAPSLIASLEMEDAAALAVEGGDAFVAGGAGGLLVVSLAEPRVRSRFDDSGYSLGIRVAGDLAYLADSEGGVRIVDVSDPDRPSLVHSIQTKRTPHAIEIDGSILFAVSRYQDVAFQTDGYLEIFDVSDPSAPLALGELEFYGWVEEIALREGILYVAMVYGPLAAIDVRDPSHPMLLSTLGPGLGFGSIALGRSLAFLSYRFHGFVVVDLSEPAALVEVARVESGGDAHGLALDGDHLYLADGDQGLGIYDVSDPRAPIEIGRTALPGTAWRVRAQNGRALVAVSGGLVRLYDVEDPTQPRSLADAELSGQISEIAPEGDRVFIAAGEQLLSSVTIECRGGEGM